MKRFNKVLTVLMIVCSSFALSACGSNKSNEFTFAESLEYHFSPEEYEKEYSEINESFTLEANTDYQIQVKSACESGTIDIGISNMNAEDKKYIVNSSAPCNDTISIPANTANAVSVVIAIEPDTKGDVVVELLSR